MKKGFTLIEVLAVLVILALLALVAVPGAMRISGDMKKELYCKKVNLILNDIKRYGDEHISSLCSSCYKQFSVKEIVSMGITKREDRDSDRYIKNPFTNLAMDDDKILLYVKNNRAYAYYVPSYSDDEDLLEKECNSQIIDINNVRLCN